MAISNRNISMAISNMRQCIKVLEPLEEPKRDRNARGIKRMVKTLTSKSHKHLRGSREPAPAAVWSSGQLQQLHSQAVLPDFTVSALHSVLSTRTKLFHLIHRLDHKLPLYNHLKISHLIKRKISRTFMIFFKLIILPKSLTLFSFVLVTLVHLFVFNSAKHTVLPGSFAFSPVWNEISSHIPISHPLTVLSFSQKNAF